MAKLPDAQGEAQQPVPQPAGGVAAYEPPNWRQVGMAGQVIQGAGRELQEAANTVASTNDRQDQIVAQSAANKLAQMRVQQEFDPSTGFRNVKEAGAVGQPFIDLYSQKFGDSVQQIRDSLINDNQRRIFDQHADVQGLQFKGALLQHQSIETEKFNDSTANGTIDMALRSMAQRPTDELGFQTGMTQIQATIDGLAKRKGLAPEATAALQGKYFDTAYSARILSLLNGIPGAVQANPYLAEKMFEQVQPKLGPQAQESLAHQVLTGIKTVQQRDVARSLVFGSGYTDPQQIYPATDDVKPLAQVVMDLESRGKRFDVNGNLLQSSAGAQGEMQVMPGTAKNPGYGVTPARDDSPEELARVGRDYVGAMTARYGDPALVLAAYNAGPGKVDEWIAKNGDPRTGQVSMQDWVEKIPFAETRNYVAGGLAKVGARAALPTKRELKTDLPALASQAQDMWSRMYPNDPVGADGVAARVMSYGNQVLAATQAQQGAAFDYMTRQLVGGAKSVDDLTSTVEGKAAWNQLTPEAQLRLQDRLKKADSSLTPEAFNTYYELLGKAGNDPAAFTQVDLTKYFGQMPDHLLLQLSAQQKSINAKDATQQAKDLNWQKAKSTVEDMLKPIGLGASAKPNTTNAKSTEQFYGRLNEAIQTFHDTNKKWPETQDIRKMGASLLTEGKQSGGMIWDSSARAYQADDQSKFYVPLPSARTPERAALIQQFTRAMGHAPSDAELQRAYTQYRLSGGK